MRFAPTMAASLILTLASCSSGDEATDPELAVAPLAELSNGECPDLSSPGEKTFRSNGLERTVTIFFPEDRPENMPVVYAFHGLSSPEYDPVGATIQSFDLDGFAEEERAVVIVPESTVVEIGAFGSFMLWGILDNEADDLALFDDLRTCVANEFDVDLSRVTAWGHSGGGLWTSALLMLRSAVLATGVVSSGGVDLSIPVLGDRLPYRTPAELIPAMLITGGDNDIWPDGFPVPIIQFTETTDALEAGLVRDGHYVERCYHDGGHFMMPSWYWRQVSKWLLSHRFGVESPYVTGEVSSNSSCTAVVAE